jgi:type II secretory pathway predicted ATPase ExeA
MIHSSDQSDSIPPFPAFPCTARYVPVGSLADAFSRICRSIDTREAVSLVIGPPGTGKSLLCGLVAQRYRQSHDVVVLGGARLDDRAAFMRHLLHHLGIDRSAVPDGDLQLALIAYFGRDQASEGGLVLIVDEAQSLETDVIEAIRAVTNIMHEGQPRISAVLCGGMKLDEVLVDRSLEAFTQRIATRCYLHPMNGDETRHYLYETIRGCGAVPQQTITDEAVTAVHHACGGVPRLVNQMLTLSIDCAAEQKSQQITDQIVNHAWAQLQQLPSPIIDEPKIAESTDVEFGELNESVSFAEWGSSSADDDPQPAQASEQPESVEQHRTTDQPETPAHQETLELPQTIEPTAAEPSTDPGVHFQEIQCSRQAESAAKVVQQEAWPAPEMLSRPEKQTEPQSELQIEARAGPQLESEVEQELETASSPDNQAEVETDVEAQFTEGEFPAELLTKIHAAGIPTAAPSEVQAEFDPTATPAVVEPELPAGVHIETYEPNVQPQFAQLDVQADLQAEVQTPELEIIQPEVAQPESASEAMVEFEVGAEVIADSGFARDTDGVQAAIVEIEFKAPTTFPETPLTQEVSNPTPPVSPPPSMLFGEYEQEEKVAIGNEFATRHPAPQPAPPPDLETMLHQEIVGISPIPDDEPSPDQIIIENNNDTIECIEEPEPVPNPVEDFIEVVEDNAAARAQSDSEVRIRIHDDRIRDDRDILVIEEEIDLRDPDPTARVDSHDQTISVDFQAMLDRMRSGS